MFQGMDRHTFDLNMLYFEDIQCLLHTQVGILEVCQYMSVYKNIQLDHSLLDIGYWAHMVMGYKDHPVQLWQL